MIQSIFNGKYVKYIPIKNFFGYFDENKLPKTTASYSILDIEFRRFFCLISTKLDSDENCFDKNNKKNNCGCLVLILKCKKRALPNQLYFR